MSGLVQSTGFNMENQDNDLKLLDDYSEELELHSTLTIARLIASHRTIRENYSELNTNTNALIQEQVERRVQLRIQELEESSYFSRERLRGMTILELTNLLTDNENER